MGKTWITDAVRERVRSGDGEFPLPIKVGGATRWISSEIHAWLAARIAEARKVA
jgi:predicted DNA-binding transcriptional regulator AlpA